MTIEQIIGVVGLLAVLAIAYFVMFSNWSDSNGRDTMEEVRSNTNIAGGGSL